MKEYPLNVLLTEEQYRWIYALLSEMEGNYPIKHRTSNSALVKMTDEMGKKIDEMNEQVGK